MKEEWQWFTRISIIHNTLHFSTPYYTQQHKSRLAGSDTKEDIQKIFELFDDDKTGYISLQNLKRVARELGETNMDDAELLEMIERADTDHDGQISSEEFYTIMTQKTFAWVESTIAVINTKLVQEKSTYQQPSQHPTTLALPRL